MMIYSELVTSLTHHLIIFNDLIQAVTANTSLSASFIMCVGVRP